MIIKGKEIKPETISMWLNILGFLIGILFYFRLENRNNTPAMTPTQAHDSVLVIDTRLNAEIRELKATQDSLVKEIRASQQSLSTQKKEVIKVRQQILSTLQSDWDSIPIQSRDAYTEKLITQLKKQQK